MHKTDSSTEERILAAAKKVFHAKGYDGARMQEIADEAGINKSLVHYYFRSKDNIFQAVFQDAFSKLLSKLNEIFSSDLPIEEKIEIFVGYYVTFLSQNSYLPLFILNGLYKQPDQIKSMLEKNHVFPERLLEQMRKQFKEEMHLDIDPLHVYINILALSIFPVIAKPLIQAIFVLDNEYLQKFYAEREKNVPEFILNALKGYENNPGK
jgi:AcrR family transcriptional regulator